MYDKLVLYSVLVVLKYAASQRYNLPTLFWGAENPLFSCEDPVIFVQYGDHLNFHCPIYDVHNRSKPFVAEDMFFVETVKEFEMFNVSAGRRFLKCSEDTAVGKCNDGGFDCPVTYNMLFIEASSSYEVNFKKGKDFYLVGKKEGNISSSVQQNSSLPLQNNPIRLRIHVCSDDEINRGVCKRSLTESYYYKGCLTTCSNWTRNENQNFQTTAMECFQLYERTCTSPLINNTDNQTKYVKIECPQIKCSNWTTTNDSISFSLNTCYQKSSRTCIDEKTGRVTKEEKIMAIKCPTTNCTSWSIDKEKTFSSDLEKCFLVYFRECVTSYLNVTNKERKIESELCRRNETTLQMAGLLSNKPNTASAMKWVAIMSSLASLLLGLVVGSITKKLRLKKLSKKEENVDGVAANVISDAELVDSLRRNSSVGDVSAVYIVNTIDRKRHRSYSVTSENKDTAYYPYNIATLPRTDASHQKLSRFPSSNSQVLLLRPVSMSTLGSVTTLNDYRRRSSSDVLSSDYQSSSASSSFKSDVFMEERDDEV